jgi:hypothetical protein
MAEIFSHIWSFSIIGAGILIRGDKKRDGKTKNVFRIKRKRWT